MTGSNLGQNALALKAAYALEGLGVRHLRRQSVKEASKAKRSVELQSLLRFWLLYSLQTGRNGAWCQLTSTGYPPIPLPACATDSCCWWEAGDRHLGYMQVGQWAAVRCSLHSRGRYRLFWSASTWGTAVRDSQQPLAGAAAGQAAHDMS